MEKKEEEAELDVSKLKKTSDGKYILPLLNPVVIGDRTLKELHLDEPRAKHLRSLGSKTSMNDILTIVEDLAHEPTHVIDALSMKDGARAAEFFGAFG